MSLSQLVFLFLLVAFFVGSGLVVVNGMIQDREKFIKAGLTGVIIALLLLLGSYCIIFEF